MKEETKDFRGRIPPLPKVKPYEPVAYDAAGIVDPFNQRKMTVEAKQQGERACVPT